MNSKNIVIAVLLLVLVGAVGYLLLNSGDESSVPVKDTATEIEKDTPLEYIEEPSSDYVEEVTIEKRGDVTVIGTSIEGSEIKAYHFGTGETELLFVGGVHGGYSWNTALVGYELVDYLKEDLEIIPSNVTVTVIPVLNPDGLKATVGTSGRFDTNEALAVSEATRITGRFNSNKVDLNRNFDCDWSETATWKNQQVSGGDAPFSEPEAAALRDYVNFYKPEAAIVWFSAEGKVYPSSCEGAQSKDSIRLAATFASAAGYDAAAEFNAYAITGDMVNWMAGKGIPAISVLLTDHRSTEWNKNKAGIEAVLKSYAN